LKGKTAMNKQTAKFISRIAENLPNLSTETMQRLIEDPADLQEILYLAFRDKNSESSWSFDKEKMEELTKGDYLIVLPTIESGGKIIIGYREGPLEARIGQVVYANGRYGPPFHTLGLVTKIIDPRVEKGFTRNIIVVHFEGCITETFMKFKDLEFHSLRINSK